MWDQNVNVKQIKRTKLNKPIYIPFDFIFTKENVEYDVDLIFPDGSLLRNYRDEQCPIFPYEFEVYDFQKNMKIKNYQIKKEIIISNKKGKNKLLDNMRLNGKNKNNELRNIDFGRLRNQIDELKKDAVFLNSNNKNYQIKESIQNDRYQNENIEYRNNKGIKNYNKMGANSNNIISLTQINEEEENNDELKENNYDEYSQNVNNKYISGNQINSTNQNYNIKGYNQGGLNLESQKEKYGVEKKI